MVRQEHDHDDNDDDDNDHDDDNDDDNYVSDDDVDDDDDDDKGGGGPGAEMEGYGKLLTTAIFVRVVLLKTISMLFWRKEESGKCYKEYCYIV